MKRITLQNNNKHTMKMNSVRFNRRDAIWSVLTVLSASMTASSDSFAHDETSPSSSNSKPTSPTFQVLSKHAIPDKGEQEITMIQIEIPAGVTAAGAHRHPGMVIGFVVAGTIETKMQAEPLATYKAGESFFEQDGIIHELLRNPSKTELARFIAIHVSQKGAHLVLSVDH